MTPPPAFEQVYADCHRQVHSLCVSLLGNPDAQDAFQDTFLAVAQALPSFRGEASVKTWVHRIAIRTALKLRARRRPSEELSDHITAGTPDPIGEHADADAVSRALGTLSFEHRLALSLFAVAGLTHAEIADTLGIPEGTVWSRLHHAKRKLGELLSAPR